MRMSQDKYALGNNNDDNDDDMPTRTAFHAALDNLEVFSPEAPPDLLHSNATNESESTDINTTSPLSRRKELIKYILENNPSFNFNKLNKTQTTIQTTQILSNPKEKFPNEHFERLERIQVQKEVDIDGSIIWSDLNLISLNIKQPKDLYEHGQLNDILKAHQHKFCDKQLQTPNSIQPPTPTHVNIDKPKLSPKTIGDLSDLQQFELQQPQNAENGQNGENDQNDAEKPANRLNMAHFPPLTSPRASSNEQNSSSPMVLAVTQRLFRPHRLNTHKAPPSTKTPTDSTGNLSFEGQIVSPGEVDSRKSILNGWRATQNDSPKAHLSMTLTTNDIHESYSGNSPRRATNWGKQLALVIDPYVLSQRLVEVSLFSLNYVVKTVSNGEDALKLMQSDRPHFDVILIEMLIQKIGGLNIVRQIRQYENDHNIEQAVIIAHTNAVSKEQLKLYELVQVNATIEKGAILHEAIQIVIKRLQSNINFISISSKGIIQQKSNNIDGDENNDKFQISSLNNEQLIYVY